MGDSRAFNRLHESVQRWVWSQNWASLRDIQEQAIDPILDANSDIIISASTASGKTEAAFLPACSHMVEQSPDGIGILYISPLKALINDQYRRLEGMSEIIGFPVTPWHGDVLQSVKAKLRKKPRGILLITPESLESMLLNQPGWCVQAFSNLGHIIIDEFHAFIGTERGCQLQSLMHRMEFLLQRTIPRVALSATLGNMQQVAQYLRSDDEYTCQIIESSTSRSDIKIQQRGYLNPVSLDGMEASSGLNQIIKDLYGILRNKSNLVFANSRGRTEMIAATLSDHCQRNNVPNEFFPHHGSLSKDLRESLESRLQQDNLPTTAVCTMTLELGIDIGSVDSIAQVTAPHSVASLRQRLGRSGRRDEASILRMFIEEEELTSKSHILDRLRLETIQCVAMVNLLLKKWYEPAPSNQYHLSTLVQQTLSVIGQYGGVRADQLWTLLCKTGPFIKVDQNLYAKFLRGLAEHELITQVNSNELVLGVRGEKLVEHFTFYTAFNTPEEYRLESNGNILGTVPIDKPLILGQHIIFAGKRWEVLHVDADKKLIQLKRAKGGQPPKFGGEGQMVHGIVRQEMFRVYLEKNVPVYLDKTAEVFFKEAVECFHELELDKKYIIETGNTLHVIPWLGDQVINTITVLFRMHGLKANCFGGVIDISDCDVRRLIDVASDVIDGVKPSCQDLAENIPDTVVEKHDIWLSDEIRNIGYGARYFDIDGAWEWLESISARI